jgi:hypothetical protein
MTSTSETFTINLLINVCGVAPTLPADITVTRVDETVLQWLADVPTTDLTLRINKHSWKFTKLTCSFILAFPVVVLGPEI